MTINVTNLRSFWHVAKHLSFTRAAEDIGVSQPVLTRQVKTLESDYGVQLFNRTTRRLTLTQEGHKLCDLCTPIFGALDDAESFLRARKEWKIKLHAVSHYGVIDFLMMVGRNFPHHHVDVDITGSHNVRRSLMERECDFGILTLTPPVEPELDFFLMGKAELIAIPPQDHSLSQYKRLPIKALHGQTLIVGSHTGQSRLVLDRALAKHQIEPQRIQTINSNNLILDLVRKGYGIGIMGYTGLTNEPAGQCLYFEESDDVALTVHMACRKERLDTSMFQTIYTLAQRDFAKKDERAIYNRKALL